MTSGEDGVGVGGRGSGWTWGRTGWGGRGGSWRWGGRGQGAGRRWENNTWAPQGKRIKFLDSSFHRPLQGGWEMLTNGLRLDQVPGSGAFTSWFATSLAFCGGGQRRVERMCVGFLTKWCEIRGSTAPRSAVEQGSLSPMSAKLILRSRTSAGPSFPLSHRTFFSADSALPQRLPDPLIHVRRSQETLTPFR